MTQKFDPKFFTYPNFCNDPKFFADPNFCNDPKTLTQNFTLTQIFWPKIFRWPKFLQWPKNVDPKFFFDPNFLTQNFTLTQIFWPKINGDPKFYNDPKILTQKFWVKGLWPGFFGSAGPKNFNSAVQFCPGYYSSEVVDLLSHAQSLTAKTISTFDRKVDRAFKNWCLRACKRCVAMTHSIAWGTQARRPERHFGAVSPQIAACAPPLQAWVKSRSRKKNTSERQAKTKLKISGQRAFFLSSPLNLFSRNRNPHHKIPSRQPGSERTLSS